MFVASYTISLQLHVAFLDQLIPIHNMKAMQRFITCFGQIKMWIETALKALYVLTAMIVLYLQTIYLLKYSSR